MRSMKEFFGMAAALFAAVMFAGGMTASASDYSLNINEEKELSSYGVAENVIEFKAPENGAFHIEVVLTDTLKGDKSENYGNVWLTTKMVYNYKTMWNQGNINRDKGWISSPEYCLPAGSTVTLNVNGNFSDYTFKYKIKVVNDGDTFYEKEDNGLAKKATSIKVKKAYSGVINDSSDVDWFVFKAQKAGKYKFVAANTEDHHGWTSFTGYKKKNMQDGNYVGIYNESGWKTIKTVTLKKGQKYYIKVARGYNNNATYKLKVKKVK